MTLANAPQDAAPHPSPHRANARLGRLLYGLIAAPAAWAASQMVNAGLAQAACYPGTQPLAAPAFGGVHALQGAVVLVALAVCASAAAVAFGAWRATRAEHPGDEHALLSVGEGRSRFMAFAGVPPVHHWEGKPIGLQQLVPPLIGFAGVYFSFNSGLVATAIGIAQRVPPYKVWHDHFAWLSRVPIC